MKIKIKTENLVHSRDLDHLKGCVKYPSRVEENKKRNKEKHKKNLRVENNF